MRNFTGLILVGLCFTGCAMKQKIMDVPVVSMTQSYLPAGAKLQLTGPVTGQFCADTFGDKGSIGLFDEAVKDAQAQNKIDFISNVSFFSSGNCVSLEGTGGKIVAESDAVSTRKK